MKKILPALIFALILSSALSKAQLVKPAADIEKIAALEQKAQGSGVEKRVQLAGQNIDMIYSRFDWQIDPAELFIRGNVTHHFQAVAEDVTEIILELNNNMVIDSVVFRSHKINHEFISDIEFKILLDEPVQLNHIDSLSIFYQGIPQPGVGFGAFIQDEHNGDPIIWTLSEPYGAKEWWPGKNDLTDKIDSIDVLVTTSQQYRAASHGILVSETASNGMKTYHWKHRYPIVSYLVALAVTNYAQFTNYAVLGGDSVPIVNYVFPEDSSAIFQETANTYEMMQLFDTLFTPYPFREEKYGHAQFSWGGGMEHQTMSFMGYFSHDIRSHELAHSWFGNMVTLASWHDIFLNEGFATYSTGLSYEHMYDGFYWDIWKFNTLGAVVSEPGGSVYVEDTTDISRIFSARLSYHKGAYLLHMLRWKLGDQDFFAAIRSYLSDPVLAYRFATLADLKFHLETAGNTDLTEFFEDWYYGEGYPIYGINVNQLEDDGKVLVTIQQDQSDPSVEYFDMPVPVQIYGEGQEETLVCDNTFSGQEFLFDNPGFEIDSVGFDKDRWLLATLAQISLGIEDRPLLGRLKIYPNPANDFVQLMIPGEKVRYVAIYNMTHQLVEQKNSHVTNEMILLDVSHFRPGIYFLSVQTEDAVYSGKFIRR